MYQFSRVSLKVMLSSFLESALHDLSNKLLKRQFCLLYYNMNVAESLEERY